MSIEISRETETRLTDEARRQGISVEALLERLMSERGVAAHIRGAAPELPVWHLGGAGTLHRRDIYDDVRCVKAGTRSGVIGGAHPPAK